MSKHPHREDCKCESKVPLDKGHPWWINAPDHGNCFWTYLRYNDRVHTLSEIAKLMKLSISAITSIERKAFSKIRKRADVIENADE